MPGNPNPATLPVSVEQFSPLSPVAPGVPDVRPPLLRHVLALLDDLGTPRASRARLVGCMSSPPLRSVRSLCPCGEPAPHHRLRGGAAVCCVHWQWLVGMVGQVLGEDEARRRQEELAEADRCRFAGHLQEVAR